MCVFNYDSLSSTELNNGLFCFDCEGRKSICYTSQRKKEKGKMRGSDNPIDQMLSVKEEIDRNL